MALVRSQCAVFEWVVATRTGMQALVGKDRNCGPELRGLHRSSGCQPPEPECRPLWGRTATAVLNYGACTGFVLRKTVVATSLVWKHGMSAGGRRAGVRRVEGQGGRRWAGGRGACAHAACACQAGAEDDDSSGGGLQALTNLHQRLKVAPEMEDDSGPMAAWLSKARDVFKTQLTDINDFIAKQAEEALESKSSDVAEQTKASKELQLNLVKWKQGLSTEATFQQVNTALTNSGLPDKIREAVTAFNSLQKARAQRMRTQRFRLSCHFANKTVEGF